MQPLPAGLSDDGSGLLDLGVALGRSHAFGFVAGRCSAAQAAGIYRVHQEKLYRRCTSFWDVFCAQYLGISRSEADKIIRLWEEFGAGYFEMAQWVRISPETYRAIQPSIQNGALHRAGEVIPINAENSRKVAAAVAELRSALPPKKPARPLETHQLLAQLDAQCAEIATQFREIARKERCGENWILFTSVLSRAADALRRIERENDVE